MNSCVDLLSPPAWWCGLKLNQKSLMLLLMLVTTCVVVWIEIILVIDFPSHPGMSPPAWWCGLKSIGEPPPNMLNKSPPAWWCGLKYQYWIQ